VVPHLSLLHLHWPVSVQSVGDLHSHVLYVLHFLSIGEAAPITWKHIRVDMDVDKDNVGRTPVQQNQLDCWRHRLSVACRSTIRARERARVPWQFDRNCALLCIVCLEYTKQHAFGRDR
jgi:hypothetical protein